jgi:thiol-disulfide isomerase/thioredoxin
MKSVWILLTVLGAWLLTGCSGGKEEAIEVGGAGFESRLLSGGQFTTRIEPSQGRYNHLRIDAYEGRPLILTFFSTSCPECIKKIPHLNDMQQRYGEKIALVGVLVESVTDEAAKEFVDLHQIRYPVAVGGGAFKLAEAVGGVRAIPATHIYNQKGQYVFHMVGPVPQGMMETRINRLLPKEDAPDGIKTPNQEDLQI